MDYYREVMTDDPFRRSERENQGDSAGEDDKGDLFGLRQRPRRLRVLIDRESLEEPCTPEQRSAEDILHALLVKHDSVLPLFVDMSKINDPDDGRDRTPNVVHVRDYSDQQGWASLPGPAYGYRIVFDGRSKTQELCGNLHPGPQLWQNLFGFAGEGGPHLQELSAEDVQRHVLLTQTGRAVADLVISESAASGRQDVAANYDANVFSRAAAIPIIAHYLRTQQVYYVLPQANTRTDRKNFYHAAVYAMAPGIQFWEAKAPQSFDDRRYLVDCREVIGRLIRALKALDDLRFNLGALQTLDSYDDAADCVDRILWSLCGAVDVMARSMHHALVLNGEHRHAKFHLENWYYNSFRPPFQDAVGIDNVDITQEALATIFKLRNTVHYRALSAAGAIEEPAPYVGKERGRVRLLIPNDVYDEIDPAEHSRWGIEQNEVKHLIGAPPESAADLATVATSAVDAVFSFLDQLCWMITWEGVEHKTEVLEKPESFTIVRLSESLLPSIRQLIGFPTTQSERLGTQYGQLDTTAPAPREIGLRNRP